MSRSSQGEKYNETFFHIFSSTYQSSRLDKCLRFKDPGGPLSVEKQAGLLAARAFQGDSDTLRGRCSLLIDTQENLLWLILFFYNTVMLNAVVITD